MNIRKQLDLKLTGSWSTYAGSMWNVLQQCGMWDSDRSFSEFMGMTGIAFQFNVHKSCAASSVTAYNWEGEHPTFLIQIGVRSDYCFALPHHSDYEQVCGIAVAEMKQSLDAGRGVVLWGVDTGEFGIVMGYNDEDRVFNVSGIGSIDGSYSNPILYSNVGRTFQEQPIMYCQFPVSYRDAIYYYVRSMKHSRVSGDYTSGLAAYDSWIHALDQEYNSFGLRYITGVYLERKLHGAAFVQSIKLESTALPLWAETYEHLAGVFRKLQLEVLEQGFDGWNHLHKPVKPSQAKLMKALLSEARSLEVKAVDLAEAVWKDSAGQAE